VKCSRSQVVRPVHKVPEIRFEDQRLTSFSGLVIYQVLFRVLGFKNRLRRCFAHRQDTGAYRHDVIALLLVVHLVIGYRWLRDIAYYKEDPMVMRVLGLRQLPDVSTVSRILRTTDARSIWNVRGLCRQLVIDRLRQMRIGRVTLDFDGSVVSTHGRMIEGTAVGFNKQKKGMRSYYPLFCTIAQTGQVFDVHHRPGNVHDSNGAKAFILACIRAIRAELPGVRIEARMDSAFFSDEIVTLLDALGVEFTLSVPFERFAQLKQMVEARKRWRYLQPDWGYFENGWKPKSWERKYRFLFLRHRTKEIRREPVQLDLFIPHEHGYAFKVIVTNRKIKAKKVLVYHNGRGAQENVFGELKSQGQMDYLAVRRLCGNQLYMLTAILAHNLNRDLQMASQRRHRGTTERRAPLWQFDELETTRRNLLQRAGRLTEPQGRLTLTMSANTKVKQQLTYYLDSLQKAA
jgi:hypothetical protein